MTTTATNPATIQPLTHREVMGLAATEYERLGRLLDGVTADEWSLPTDCEKWTVRDLSGHLVGAMRAAASLRENLRQLRGAGKRHKTTGGQLVDHLTDIQVAATADLTADELVAEYHRLAPKALRGRRHTPAPARRLVRIGVEMGDIKERWQLGYFVGVILTRDQWMHRVDLSRALDREIELTAEHDGRMVADIAAEWFRRHGKPAALELTGPAGDTFVSGEAGDGGEPITIDAIEFARTLAGRAPATGLLATQVPF